MCGNERGRLAPLCWTKKTYIGLPRFGAKRYSEIERDDVQQMVFDLVPDRLQRATMLNVLKTLRLVIKWQCRNDKTVYNADLTADLEYPRTTPMKTKPEKAEP